MSASFAIDSSQAQNDTTQATQVVRGTITLSGNYGSGSSHGDTLALNVYGVQSATLVGYVINELPAAGTAPTGYIWGFAKGTTLANGKLTCMNGTTEYTEGSAYSAGQKAAVIKATFYFIPYQ